MPKITIENTKQLTRKAVGIAVIKNKPQVVALFQKYGVAVDNSYDTNELIVGVYQAMVTSPGFRRDLVKLLSASMTEHKQHFTEDIYNFSAGGPSEAGSSAGDIGQAANSLTSQSTTMTTPSSNSSLGAGLFSAGNLSNLLNTGLTVLSNSLKSKSDQKLANTALQIEAEKTKQAALSTGATTAVPTAGLSSGAKIGIVVGILAVVGATLYFVLRKKSK